MSTPALRPFEVTVSGSATLVVAARDEGHALSIAGDVVSACDLDIDDSSATPLTTEAAVRSAIRHSAITHKHGLPIEEH